MKKIKPTARLSLIGFFFVLAHASPLMSQVVPDWVTLYDNPNNGEDLADAIAIDGHGNILVTGHSSLDTSNTQSQYYDFLTIKYNQAGQMLWAARLDAGGIGGDHPHDIAVDSANNVYVTGSAYDSSLEGQIYLTVKYDSNGTEQWQARYDGVCYGPDRACALGLDHFGNVYVTGTGSCEQTIWDIVTLKYNEIGDLVWVATCNGAASDYDYPCGIVVAPNGESCVAGTGTGIGTMLDYLIAKYDPNGNELWRACYDGPASGCDETYAITSDLRGNIYVTGRSPSSPGWFPNDDILTIKYSPSGNLEWTARYDGPLQLDESGDAIVVDSAGCVYVVGTGELELVTGQWIIIKYNARGEEQWIQTWPGYGQGAICPTSMILDEQANVYVTGYVDTNPTSGWNHDFLTLKYDSNGNLIWEILYNGLANENDEACDIALDEMGNAYVTGYSIGVPGGRDFCTIKYIEASSMIGGNPVVTRASSIFSAYPNPFNATTILTFDLPVAGLVKLEVFDINGRSVTSGSGTAPTTEWFPAGTHQLTFDDSGLPSGIYLARLTAEDWSVVQKLVLLK